MQDIYKESKDGNIYFSKYHKWDFEAVPWSVEDAVTGKYSHK